MYLMSTGRPMHDEAVVAASPSALELATGDGAAGAWRVEPGSSIAELLTPAERDQLVWLLRDPQHRFPVDQGAALVSLIGAALPALRSWIDWPATVWCAPGQPIPGPVDPSSLYLLVTAVRRDTGWELHTAFTGDLRPDQVAIPAHGRADNQFRCPPNDLLDALALTLENELAQPVSVLRLRQILADWLESGPVEERPLSPPQRWPHLAPQLGLQSGLDPAPQLAPQPALEPTPHDRTPPQPSPRGSHAALSAWLQARGHTAAGPSSSRRASELNNAIPVALRSRTQALAHALRQGQWHEVLDRMAPQLLARLPPSHPCRLGAVDVTLGDGTPLCFNPAKEVTGWRVHCAPGMARIVVPPFLGNLAQQTFQGPDGYLQALMQGDSGGAVRTTEVRHLLADLIESHPTVSALMLAIFDRWPERDPEVMLRFCLHGDTLQRAGLQLLDPSRPARDLSPSELWDWQRKPIRTRLDETPIVREGISLADVRWHCSPLRLSRYGVEALVPPLSFIAPHWKDQIVGVKLLKQSFPQLRYELGSMYQLCMYLQLSPEELMKNIDAKLSDRATDYCERMTQQGVLLPSLPSPGLQPLPSSSPVTEPPDTDQGQPSYP